MAEREEWQAKLQELVDRKWEIQAIEARCKLLMTQGIPNKMLDRNWIQSHKQEILDRVQLRGEEYNYFVGNCARSTALAVMEEFGLGNMEIIKALSPFPGFGGTGWMCGGVTGGLITLGLFQGSDNLRDHEAVAATMKSGRKFMIQFENEVGVVTCRKIQEDVVFDRFMDPAASPENMEAFAKARGFEKCSLLAGIGARIAAGIIIESVIAPGNFLDHRSHFNS
jgi:C_GCAxxG_C_C family probable redox protein